MSEPDGAEGCTEIWERMSEERATNKFDPAIVPDHPMLNEIGDTSLVPLHDESNLLLKKETQNPTGSKKDRLAAGMIALKTHTGDITSDSHIVESSSGNTAGSVAFVCSCLDYDCTIVAKESVNRSKLGYVKSLGADVVLAPADAPYGSPENYQSKGKEVANSLENGVFLNQYESSLNPLVHEGWTGTEIEIQTDNVAAFVSAMGTGGTITGIGRALKDAYSDVEVYGVDAIDSNIWREFKDKETTEYHADVEGLGQWRVTESSDFSVIDDIVPVGEEVANSKAKMVAQNHGHLVGPSTGAVLHVAETVVEPNVEGDVVCMVHDGAEQYWDTLVQFPEDE